MKIKIVLLGILFCWSSAWGQEKISLSSLELVANQEQVRKIEKGNKALVYFWAVWCKDCKKSMKTSLNSLHTKNVPIFAINRDRSVKKVKHHIEKHKISIPIYRDSDKSISKKLKAFSVPHWAVVEYQGDGNYSVLKIASGDMSEALTHF